MLLIIITTSAIVLLILVRTAIMIILLNKLITHMQKYLLHSYYVQIKQKASMCFLGLCQHFDKLA